MTDKQKNMIIYLDSLAKKYNLPIRANDSELLGDFWWIYYKNFTIAYANEVIDKLSKALGIDFKNKKKGGKK